MEWGEWGDLFPLFVGVGFLCLHDFGGRGIEWGMSGSITYDNYGVGPSREYEERIRQYDPSVGSAGSVAKGAQKDNTKPFYSESVRLFELERSHLLWSKITKPVNWDDQNRGLFSHCLARGIGGMDKMDILMQRIEDTQEAQGSVTFPAGTPDWMREKQLDKVHKQAGIWRDALDTLGDLSDMLDLANMERSRYSKG
ncbi:MAG: hypothetical protein S4CHLAM102_14800 [Chlamydiia bacterium]|nr:hypothetical protein [Chlamydiia bacterium]